MHQTERERYGPSHMQFSPQILHFLYELEPEASKRSFWADQLRRAVMVRYGSVGHDINHVRRLLQHTRTVLRQRHGMQQVCQSGGVAFI
jgi:hypothetical protein